MFQQRIYFFMSVVEEGSFSSAAKKHYLSQSAISQQMGKLEEETGFKIFDRSSYRPKLTEAGKYYYEQCRTLVEKYQTIAQKAKKIAESERETIKIGITGPFENRHVPAIVSKYREKFPQCRIDVKICSFKKGVDMLEAGTLDLAFGITNEFINHNDIEVVTILHHKICAVCSLQHPFAKRDGISGKELGNENIIALSPTLGSSFYHDFLAAFEQDGIRPRIVKEVNDLEEAFLSVKLNEGIAILSKEVVSEQDNLHCVPIYDSHHHADFCVGYRKNNDKNLKPLVETVLSYFRETFAV